MRYLVLLLVLIANVAEAQVYPFMIQQNTNSEEGGIIGTDDPPVVANAISNISCTEGGPSIVNNLDNVFTDDNGIGNLSYSLTGNPVSTSISGSIVNTSCNIVVSENIEVCATDGASQQMCDNFSVAVSTPGAAPVVAMLNEVELSVGTSTYDFSQHCSGANPKNYEILDEPRGGVSISNNGTITAQPGVYHPIVLCENGAGRDSTDFLLIARATPSLDNVIGVSNISQTAINLGSGLYSDGDWSNEWAVSNGAVTETGWSGWASTQQLRLVMAPLNLNYLLAQTESSSRDHVVRGYPRRGIMLARMSNGKAFFLEQSATSINVGFLSYTGTGINSNITLTKNNFFNEDIGNIPDTGAPTDNKEFQIRVEGTGISACFDSGDGNCEEFYSDPYVAMNHMESGKAAFQAYTIDDYGFRNIGVEFLSRLDYGDTDFDTGIVIAEEFGASTFSTTGSISAGSNQLTVANASGFSVGDSVIVQETVFARFDTTGVGGYWPGWSIATQADTSGLTPSSAPSSAQSTSRVLIRDTGDIWEYFASANDGAGGWFNQTYNNEGNFQSYKYYFNSPVPVNLETSITAINGNILTLSKNAHNSVTNANVYFDNRGSGWFKLAQNESFHNFFGEGHYVMASSQDINLNNGSIVGEGKNRTILGSVPGSRSLQWLLTSGDDLALVQDHTIRGTLADFGYYGWDTRNGYNVNTASNFRAFDLKCQDTPNSCVNGQYADRPWVYRGEHHFSDGQRRYVQWAWQFADSHNGNPAGGCVDCMVIPDPEGRQGLLQNRVGLTPAFEAFDSENIEFHRPIAYNGSWACNSCSGMKVYDMYTRIGTRTQGDTWGQVTGNSMANINDNIKRINTSGTRPDQPLVVDGMRIIFDGPFEVGDDSFIKGLTVAPDTIFRNLTFKDIVYWMPDSWRAPMSQNNEAASIRATKPTAFVTVDNFRAMTRSRFNNDIEFWGQTDGIIQNSVADKIGEGIGTESNNQTIDQWIASQPISNPSPVSSFEVIPRRGRGEFQLWGWPSTDNTLIKWYDWDIDCGGGEIYYPAQILPYMTLALDEGQTCTISLTVTDEFDSSDTNSCSLNTTTGVCS